MKIPRRSAFFLVLVLALPCSYGQEPQNLIAKRNDMDLRRKDLPETIAIHNAVLDAVFRTTDGTLSVADKRTKQTSNQRPLSEHGAVRTAMPINKNTAIDLRWSDAASGVEAQCVIALDGDKPEFTVTLSADGKLPKALAFPHPFVSETGTWLVVPMNEGISYPVEGEAVKPMRLVAYGGHGICMAFWGVTDGERGLMAIIETSDDAAIRIARADGRLCVAPEWDSQKGQFGYPRRLRYVFFDKGGHVAIAKRYRSYAKEVGLLKTLEEKRKENPNVDLLVGAVNVWYRGKDPLEMLREMKAAGIERILWSSGEPADVIKAMNAMDGVLTSRYDIYQDLMDPETVKDKLKGIHNDWTQAGWPKDIMLDEKGQWRKGWGVKGKDGVMYSCGVLCDKQAPKYARERVPAELKEKPYRCRFIDTTTASPWRECYSPDHPMTRSDSRHWKMELLRFMSEDMKLVTGSETGHEASVPYVHYYEGMLSLGQYRVKDAGRNMGEILEEVPEQISKFQVGQRYRLPLWQLVYGDCVVAQWYWGDYNNKLPAVWDKRDLFNALYATPPMFMFSREFWEKNKDRFARSYRAACPIARAAGYSEMTAHRFLTPERDVQQTAFANGGAVTANFGDKPFRLPDGKELAPMACDVKGLPK